VRNVREGVSFEKLFSLAPYLDNPAAARSFMVRWALLQLLIGTRAGAASGGFCLRAGAAFSAPRAAGVEVESSARHFRDPLRRRRVAGDP
jgi:serine/threonine-protein kinase HipA